MFMLAAVQAGDPQDRYWVAETESDAGDPGMRWALLDLSSSGLRTWSTGDAEESRTFDPPRPEVPADPRPGQQVTTEGRTTVFGSDETSYSSTLDVIDAEDGCLEFRRTDRIADGAPVTSSRVRCADDRGIVRERTPAGEWVAVDDWPAGDDPRAGVDLTPAPGGALRDLNPEPLQVRRLGVDAPMPPVAPGEMIGDRVMVGNLQTGNIAWLSRDGDELSVTEWADAGGDLITLGRCGEVTVAATTRRELVAFDGRGRWLWTTVLEDVAGSRPVRSGDRLLVATRDSRLNAVDCRTGNADWATSGINSSVSPAVSATGVLVADEAGVRLLDPETGAARWDRTLPNGVSALGLSDRVAIAGDAQGLAHAIDPATGERRRIADTGNSAREIHFVGETPVIRTTTSLVGLDVRGERRWVTPFTAMASLADSDHVLAVSPQEIVLLDHNGTEVARTSHAMSYATATLVASPTPDGALVIDGFGRIVLWRAE